MAVIGPTETAGTDPSQAQLMLPIAVIAIILIAAFSTTTRAAQGRLCLMNAW